MLLYSGVPVLLGLLSLPVPAAGLSCMPCETFVCEPVTCEGAGRVPDVCGCCQVCPRREGQSCGGYFGGLGHCAAGLVCRTAPHHGQAVSQQQEGVCVRNDTTVDSCDGTNVCQLILGTCVCTQLAGCSHQFDLSKDPTAFTSLEECEKAAGKQTSVQRTATPPALPSVIVPSCPDVRCEEPVTQCPRDSVLKTVRSGRPRCCPPVTVCECDLESCAVEPVCLPDQRAVEVHPANASQPGHCCQRWQCKTKDEIARAAESVPLDCVHDGRRFEAGERWAPDKCTRCQCKDGLAFCKTRDCPPLTGCGRVLHSPQHCCPSCVDGCTSPSGVHHNNSEQWQENDCTTCTCTSGLLHCHSEMCHVTCRRPRHVPGRCCPVCDECDISCQHGRRRDETGRLLCSCRSAEDEKEDQQRGQEDMESTTPAVGCPDITDCRRLCPHGLRTDRHGCKRCKCKKCASLRDCQLTCSAGYRRDPEGCPVCQCAPVEEVTGSTPLTDPNTPQLSCASPDGAVHGDGETWRDGCHHCYCHSGRELCTVITCPAPRCAQPDILTGQCCPTCPDEERNTARGLNVTVCEAADGSTYVEGDEWRPDGCTGCLCHAGRVLCTQQRCPPAACPRPARRPTDICALCPASPPPPPPGSRPSCPGGQRHGEVWRQDACTSCRCLEGHISCFQETCPPLNCVRPVLRKHQCCPACPELAGLGETPVCRYRDGPVPEGSTWDVDPCTSCVCQAGQVQCAKKICPVTCQTPQPVEGQCCPVCPDDVDDRVGQLYGNNTSGGVRSGLAQRPSVLPGAVQQQTSPPSLQPETDGSGPSAQTILVYSLVAVAVVIALSLATLLYCCVRRHRNRYSPKSGRCEETKPLSVPQMVHFSQLGPRGVPSLSPSPSLSAASSRLLAPGDTALTCDT